MNLTRQTHEVRFKRKRIRRSILERKSLLLSVRQGSLLDINDRRRTRKLNDLRPRDKPQIAKKHKEDESLW